MKTPQFICHQIISLAYSSVQLLFLFLFPPLHRWVNTIYNQLLHHSIHSYLLLKNDCHRKMRVVWFFQNIGIDSTYAYINTIINNQEDSHSTHFSLSMFNTGAMVITDDTHSHFSNSFISVSFTFLGKHCLYNLDLSIFPLWLGQN